MKSEMFRVDVCQENGYITAITNPFDRDPMNWCASEGKWGRIF